MRKWLLIPVLACLVWSSQVQAQGVWKNLAEVSYKISEDQFGELYVPVFSENIKKLEGKVGPVTQGILEKFRDFEKVKVS